MKGEHDECQMQFHIYLSKDRARMTVVGSCSTCKTITLGIFDLRSGSMRWAKPDLVSNSKSLTTDLKALLDRRW